MSSVSLIRHALREKCRSLWGYHVIDYPEFVHLKSWHKRMLKAYRALKRHYSVIRKAVHNRTQEAGYCSLVSDIDAGPGHSLAVFKRLRSLLKLYKKLLEAYQIARKPTPNPDGDLKKTFCALLEDAGIRLSDQGVTVRQASDYLIPLAGKIQILKLVESFAPQPASAD